MVDLVFNILRFALLALLWIFVISVVVWIRRDITTSASKRFHEKSDAYQANELALIYFVKGTLEGNVYHVKKPNFLIGRASDVALRIDTNYVSAKHARVFCQGEKWFIEDLDSTNGTFLAGKRIYGVSEFPFDVPLKIGENILSLKRSN